MPLLDEDLDPLADVGQVVTPSSGNAPSALDMEIASADVRERCGWHISPVMQETVTLNGTGGRTLLLPTLRLLSVDAISVGGVAYDPANLFVDDVEWTEAGILSRYYGLWPVRRRAIEVTFTHGYPLPPKAVTGVVLGLCGRRAVEAAGQLATTVTQSLTTITKTPTAGGVPAGTFTPLEEAVLARYTIPPGN